MANQQEYDYGASGFDKFFNRSVEDLPQRNLDANAPPSMAIPFDRGQQSGSIGDSFKVGNVQITNTGIVVDDGNNSRVFIGNDSGF